MITTRRSRLTPPSRWWGRGTGSTSTRLTKAWRRSRRWSGWVSAGLFEVTRWWEGAWRIPSFAAALVLLWLIARWATAAYGATAGLLACSAFGLNLLAPRLATLVRTDMPLALVTFLIGAQIWRKIQRGGAVDDARSGGRLSAAGGRDLDQGADRLRVHFAGAGSLPISPAQERRAERAGAAGGRGFCRWRFFSPGRSAASLGRQAFTRAWC